MEVCRVILLLCYIDAVHSCIIAPFAFVNGLYDKRRGLVRPRLCINLHWSLVLFAVAVAAEELVHTTGGVHKLLLTGEERVR